MSFHDWFKYDPETGNLYWKRQPAKNIQVGTLAGYITNNGYRYVSLKSKKIAAHRIVWSMHGKPPTEQIDHIDGNRLNNKIENLRAATNSENQQNLKKHKAHNKCGVLGVYQHKAFYRSSITINNVRYQSPLFRTIEEAKQWYDSQKEILHPYYVI